MQLPDFGGFDPEVKPSAEWSSASVPTFETDLGEDFYEASITNVVRLPDGRIGVRALAPFDLAHGLAGWPRPEQFANPPRTGGFVVDREGNVSVR